MEENEVLLRWNLPDKKIEWVFSQGGVIITDGSCESLSGAIHTSLAAAEAHDKAAAAAINDSLDVVRQITGGNIEQFPLPLPKLPVLHR